MRSEIQRIRTLFEVNIVFEEASTSSIFWKLLVLMENKEQLLAQ